MKYRETGPWRAAGVIAVSVSLLGAVPASADLKASLKCRGTIAKGAVKVIKTGLKLNDKCHKAQDKAPAATAVCNNVANPQFDPKGKYADAETKASDAATADCLSGDPVLDNYDGMSVAAVHTRIDGTVGGNSALVIGGANLAGDGTKTKCVETIAKARTKIVSEIVKISTKCQKDKDAAVTDPANLGAIDPACIDAGAKSTEKALASIPKACGALTAADVGTCSPLAQCVVDASVSAGQALARVIYHAKVECGNGIVEGSEECDDGNTTNGDGCSSTCTVEPAPDTCTPITGTRTVRVSLNTPAPLGGVTVFLDYPQFQTSIPGTKNSASVKSRVTIYPSGGFSTVNDRETDFVLALAASSDIIPTGNNPLFDVQFDQCAPSTVNVCNRSQNVTGCCNNMSDTNQFHSCPAGTGNAGTICVQDADCTPFDPVNCTGTGTPNACCTGSGTGPTCIPGDASACTSAGTPFTCCTGAGTGPNCTPQCPVACYSNPPICSPGFFPQVVDNTPPFKVGVQTVGMSIDPTIESGPCFKHCSIVTNRVCSVNSDCDPPTSGDTCVNSGPNGGCPGDNVCVDQASVTACSVSDPVDHNGTPVAGVSCSTAILP
jgi:cysteine-rich repeat protein